MKNEIEVLLFSVAMLVIVAVLYLPISLIQKQYDKYMCTRFTQETNRETKFTVYHFFKWDCLAKTGDTYLPIDRLREID